MVRYTLTDRAIAVLLALVMLFGSALAFAENYYEEGAAPSENIETPVAEHPTYIPQPSSGNDSEQQTHILDLDYDLGEGDYQEKDTDTTYNNDTKITDEETVIVYPQYPSYREDGEFVFDTDYSDAPYHGDTSDATYLISDVVPLSTFTLTLIIDGEFGLNFTAHGVTPDGAISGPGLAPGTATASSGDYITFIADPPIGGNMIQWTALTDSGAEVVVTPVVGQDFHWSMVMPSENVTVTASHVSDSFAITFGTYLPHTNRGSVISSLATDTASITATIIFTATPSAGYRLSHFTISAGGGPATPVDESAINRLGNGTVTWESVNRPPAAIDIRAHFEPATLFLNGEQPTHSVNINDGNLSPTVAVTGNAVGSIQLDGQTATRIDLVQGITAIVDYEPLGDGDISFEVDRANLPGGNAVNDIFNITVTRQGVTRTLTVNVNVTPITVTLNPNAVTITQPSQTVPTPSIAVGGDADGDIGFVDFTFEPSDPTYLNNTPADAWPTGLTPNLNGNAITVSSTNLTFRDNGVYTVVVTRGGARATLTVTVNIPVPNVTEVTVTPNPASVAFNDSAPFTATVIGTNSPPQGVVWSISGNSHTGTTIGNDGVLFIHQDEASGTITVRATSGFTIPENNPPSSQTPNIYGEATVTVINPVVEVAVITQPTQLGSDINALTLLDLTGLVIRTTQANGATADFTFPNNFGDFEISPANGTQLTMAHDGMRVRITHTASGLYADTNPVSVVNPVTGIAVINQPINLTQTLEAGLDLSGLVVTLTFADLTTQNVPLADFAANGLTAAPVQGTPVAGIHHNAPIAITHEDGPSVTTANLTVRARLTFNSNGGTFASNGGISVNRYVTYGGSLPTTELPEATRPGFSFIQWLPINNYTNVTTNRTLLPEWGPIPVTGIDVVRDPDNLTYTVTQQLDLSGLRVRLTFDPTYYGQAPHYVDFSVANFLEYGLTANPAHDTDMTLANNSEHITITHTASGLNAQTQNTLTVTDPIVSITITTQPQLEYNVGDLLDLSALVVTLTRASGDTVPNVAFANFNTNGLSTTPQNGITLSHVNHNGTQIRITHTDSPPPEDTAPMIVNDPVTSIEVHTQPTNLTYDLGDSLNLAGLVVTLHFGERPSQNVPYPFTGFETRLAASPVGGTTIVVAHHGQSVAITYTPETGPALQPANTNPLTVYAVVTFALGVGILDDGYGSDDLVQRIQIGDSATPPGTSRPGFNHTGWDGEYTNVNSNRTITAQWARIPVTGIAVTTNPTTMSYNHGNLLNLSGIVVRLDFDDGSSHYASLAEFETYYLTALPAHNAPLDVAVHDGAPVVITYSAVAPGGPHTADTTDNLTVRNPVTGIVVTTQPTNLVYIVNQTLDLTGLIVTLTRTNGDTQAVAFADFAANGLSATPVHGSIIAMANNNQPVVITYTDSVTGADHTANTNTLTVTNPVTGIAVAEQLTNLTQTLGEELNLSGLVVTLTFADLTTQNVPLAGFAANGLTTYPTAGTLITGLHDGVPIVITHIDPATSNELTANTTALSVNARVTFNLRGGTLVSGTLVQYILLGGNATAPVVTPPPGFTFNAAVWAPSFVNVAANIDVYPQWEAIAVTGIAIHTQPRLAYIVGQELDLSGISVTLNFSDGSSHNATFAQFGLYSLEADPQHGQILDMPLDGQPVTITHTGFADGGPHYVDTNNLTVTNPIVSIGVASEPTRLVYTLDEALELDGLVVTLEYADGTTRDVAVADFGTNNLIANPANGVTLTFAHHNNPVVITYTGARAPHEPELLPETTASLTVNRLPGSDIANPATEASVANHSLTVYPATLATATGQSIEYAISTSSVTAPITGWQSGLTFSGLSPGATYFVWARSAANARHETGLPMVSADITTVPLPTVTSITPASATVAEFMNVPYGGFTQEAVFYITGTNLLRNQAQVANAFSVSQFSGFITHQNLTVTILTETTATLTVYLTVLPNNQTSERAGSITIGNTITSAPAGGSSPLTVSQLAPPYFMVTIAHNPAGSMPTGNPTASGPRQQGTIVNLNAGTRAGFTFSGWTSNQVDITNEDSAGGASFTMPNGPVVINANWTQLDTYPPTTPQPPQPPLPQPPLPTTPQPPPPQPPTPTTPPPNQQGLGDGDDEDSNNENNADDDVLGDDDDEDTGFDHGDDNDDVPGVGIVDPGDGTGTGTDGDEAGTGDASDGGSYSYYTTNAFWNWLRNNLWWLLLNLGALLGFLFWFVFFWRRRKNKEESEKRGKSPA